MTGKVTALDLTAFNSVRSDSYRSLTSHGMMTYFNGDIRLEADIKSEHDINLQNPSGDTVGNILANRGDFKESVATNKVNTFMGDPLMTYDLPSDTIVFHKPTSHPDGSSGTTL